MAHFSWGVQDHEVEDTDPWSLPARQARLVEQHNRLLLHFTVGLSLVVACLWTAWIVCRGVWTRDEDHTLRPIDSPRLGEQTDNTEESVARHYAMTVPFDVSLEPLQMMYRDLEGLARLYSGSIAATAPRCNINADLSAVDLVVVDDMDSSRKVDITWKPSLDVGRYRRILHIICSAPFSLSNDYREFNLVPTDELQPNVVFHVYSHTELISLCRQMRNRYAGDPDTLICTWVDYRVIQESSAVYRLATSIHLLEETSCPKCTVVAFRPKPDLFCRQCIVSLSWLASASKEYAHRALKAVNQQTTRAHWKAVMNAIAGMHNRVYDYKAQNVIQNGWISVDDPEIE